MPKGASRLRRLQRPTPTALSDPPVARDLCTEAGEEQWQQEEQNTNIVQWSWINAFHRHMETGQGVLNHHFPNKGKGQRWVATNWSSE